MDDVAEEVLDQAKDDDSDFEVKAPDDAKNDKVVEKPEETTEAESIKPVESEVFISKNEEVEEEVEEEKEVNGEDLVVEKEVNGEDM